MDKNKKLLAIMTFGKSRFSKHAEYELLRYCSLKNHNIVGGASKLLREFQRQYPDKSIISYSKKEFNTGNMYSKLGFKKIHSSSPAYYYTKDYSTIHNRVAFQKHKLASLLENYDSNLSEWDNMQNNGYDRIWDCGNDVWLLNPFD